MFVLPFQEWCKHSNNGTAPHRYKWVGYFKSPQTLFLHHRIVTQQLDLYMEAAPLQNSVQKAASI